MSTNVAPSIFPLSQRGSPFVSVAKKLLAFGNPAVPILAVVIALSAIEKTVPVSVIASPAV